MAGAATTGSPTLSATGSDTNVHLFLAGKGTGSVMMPTQNANYVQMTGNTAGSSPLILASGSDTNIAITLGSKGSGQVAISTSSTNRFTVSTTAATLTLPLTLPADPTTALQAATKQYVDAAVATRILSMYAGGLVADTLDTIILSIPITASNAFRLPAGAANCAAIAETAATASRVVTINDGTTNVGTITWAIGGTVGTWSVASDADFTNGKKFKLTRTLPWDATLDRIGFTVVGSKL
jgi:hypothetical protein